MNDERSSIGAGQGESPGASGPPRPVDAGGRCSDRPTDEPPADEAARRALLQLALLPGLGPRTLAALLERFGSAAAVLSAPGDALIAVSGVGPKLLHTIRTASDHVDVDSVLRWCRQQDCRLLMGGTSAYPRPLSDLHDAPPLLFARGAWASADELAVAIVGTRHATSYGTRQADRLAYGLAQAGVTVVSGLARGIDAAAHQGALAGGGRTVAVLGGGLAQIYPAEHADLAATIAGQGVLFSEYAPQAKPKGGMFPQRNRIIASLALATLVIEAPDRSGALITARHAGELGRDVLALPGPVTSRASRGTHALIREGATLVQTVDDILESLGPMARSVETEQGHALRQPAELTLNDQERRILACIAASGTLVDHVIQDSGVPTHQVMATLSVLEMRRLIRRLSGHYVARI